MMPAPRYYNRVELGPGVACLMRDNRPLGLLVDRPRPGEAATFIPAAMLDSYVQACVDMPDDMPDLLPAIARFRLIQTRATQ
jgi:hypothetical protein